MEAISILWEIDKKLGYEKASYKSDAYHRFMIKVIGVIAKDRREEVLKRDFEIGELGLMKLIDISGYNINNSKEPKC